MKPKLSEKKKIILTILCLLLAAVWIWRYHSVNHFYHNHTTRTIAYYSMEEEVPFEDDFLELHESAENCFIRVGNYEIADFVDYVQKNRISLDSRQGKAPEKLVLVQITLYNRGPENRAINLTNFALFGIDSNPPMDYELLCQINPILSGGSWGIALHQSGKYQITLPYMLFSDYYGYSTWNNLGDYTFYLQCTSFPTVKCIQLSPLEESIWK